MLVGVAPLPLSFPPSNLLNIAILHHKQAKLPKHLQHSVAVTCSYLTTEFNSSHFVFQDLFMEFFGPILSCYYYQLRFLTQNRLKLKS